jgi:hypothetical protein
MYKERIISYFTQIYYNITFFFNKLSRKPYMEYNTTEHFDEFDEFIDIDNEEKDNVSLLRKNRIHKV